MTLEFIRARWYQKVDGDRGIDFIVIHDMEASENLNTAENCARYLQTTDRKVSAHICADADSRVRCVEDKDVAYATPSGNRHGLQLELAGYANQSLADWSDTYSSRMLKEQGAPQVADWCQLHKIPNRFLTMDDILAARRAGVPYRGVTTHWEHNKAMKILDPGKPGTYSHWDPGRDFPMAWFLGLVQDILEGTPTEPTPTPPTPTPTPPVEEVVLKDMPTVKMGSSGTPVLTLQTMLIIRGYMRDAAANKDGIFGSGTDSVVRRYQQDKGLVVDGIVGPQTWGRLGKV